MRAGGRGGAGGKGTATYVDMLPPSGPAFNGTYDFDLLQPVIGEACVSWNDNANYWAFSTSGGVGEGFGLKPKAEAAASPAPAAGSTGTGACYRDTDCPGALVCRDHVCVTSK